MVKVVSGLAGEYIVGRRPGDEHRPGAGGSAGLLLPSENNPGSGPTSGGVSGGPRTGVGGASAREGVTRSPRRRPPRRPPGRPPARVTVPRPRDLRSRSGPRHRPRCDSGWRERRARHHPRRRRRGRHRRWPAGLVGRREGTTGRGRPDRHRRRLGGGGGLFGLGGAPAVGAGSLSSGGPYGRPRAATVPIRRPAGARPRLGGDPDGWRRHRRRQQRVRLGPRWRGPCRRPSRPAGRRPRGHRCSRG